MSQFCSIQELSSFEGSEASPLIINPAPVNLAKLDLNTNRHSDSDTMTSSTKTCEEKSPTLEGLVFNSDLDTIVRKGKRDYQEGLLLYKHLKETTFFKDFKLQFNKDLRTIDALMYLSRVIRYEYHMPRSVIYKKGDLSNQKVYIVYSGEVNVWVGKPDGNALKLGSHKSSEPQEMTPKVSNDNLQLLKIKSGGFGGGNTKIRRRQNRVIDKLKRVTSTETPKTIMTQTAPKARTLKKQFTFDGFFSHPNVTKLSEINHQNSTNSRTLTEDSEVNSREILYARPPGAERRSVEPGKEKKMLDYGLSRRRLNSNLLANPLTLNIKDTDEQASFTPESCGGEYGFPSRSVNKDGIDMDLSGRGSSEAGKDSHFVLRKVNFKRANTFNLDLTTSTPMNGNNTSINRNTSEGGYIKETIRKGGHFGDEILRSSQPREDTIVTSTPCELLVFNVEAYEYLMTRFERTNTQVMNFLMDYIPGLEEALNQKKITRPDLYFKEETYQLHNHVMIEGNKGKKLYLLFEGTCQVLKSLNGPAKNKGPRKSYTTSGEMVICNIQPGVFIGEEILFNQEGEYEYTIKAASAQVKVLAISAQSFKESMPKLANQTLESLYFSKKQKNLEIMDARMDFSKDLEKLQQAATSPKNSDAVVQMQTKIIKTQNQVYGTRHYQEKPEPVISKHSYTVEFALPGGREGSKLLNGLKFKRYPNQTPEPQARKVSISVEKEELMRTEPEQPLSEMEKKLRRYLHQGFIKKSATPKATTCSSKDGEVSFKNLKTQGSFDEYSGNKENYNSNTIQRLSLGLGKEKKERARENSFSRLKEAERSMSNGRRTFGGFGERTLSQIMAQVSPTREKFVGDLPLHLKKLHAPRFSQGFQKNGNISQDNLKIKVNVDVKTKRVTYGVASVKPKQHNSTKSQGFSSENNEVLLSVKTASMTRSERQLKSRLSEKRAGSMRETPEQFTMLGESGMEGRLTEKLKGLGRMSINAKMDECK